VEQSAGSPTKRQSYRTTNRGTVHSVVLITGATDNVGRHDASHLLRSGATGRALTRDPESAALPRGVDVARGDLSFPDTLNACLDGVEPICLVWPFFTAEAALAFLEAVTKHARRTVYLSSEGVGDDLEKEVDTIIAPNTTKGAT
jgi:uncharacterized protein YbjT (DUF2867 family)